MRNIEIKVQNFIKNKKLLSQNIATVYAAVSGGADSMALLFFLRHNIDLNIIAVHVNHGIRGASADKDQAFVEKYCEDHNIKCIVFNAREDNIQIPEKASEDWARNLRYNYFNTLDMTNAVIATAHTSSDQIETVLFRLARGCGMNGLSGIPTKRDNIIRPFLCLNRNEVEKLVEYYQTGYITDESNLTDDYARNKIRHHIIPVMKEINTNAEYVISKVCERASRMNDFVYQYANEQLQKSEYLLGIYHTNLFANNHQAVVEQMLMIMLQKYEYADNLIEDIYHKLQEVDFVKEEYVLVKHKLSNTDTLIVTNRIITIQHDVAAVSLKEGKNNFGEWQHGIEIKQLTREEYELLAKDKRQLAFVLNGDVYNISDFIMHQKQNGDKFKPACRYKTKVSHHMNGLYMSEKANVPVVKNEKGDVIFLHNVGFTDNMLPDKKTKTIYYFSSY